MHVITISPASLLLHLHFIGSKPLYCNVLVFMGTSICIALVAVLISTNTNIQESERESTVLDSEDTPLPLLSTPQLPLNNEPECLRLDKNDPRDINLKQLSFLEYRHERQVKPMRIRKKIAGHWKKIGVLFGFDVDQIGKNHNHGTGYMEDCCQEVLAMWINANLSDYPNTWNGLIKVLEHVELAQVVTDIEDALTCVIA